MATPPRSSKSTWQAFSPPSTPCDLTSAWDDDRWRRRYARVAEEDSDEVGKPLAVLPGSPCARLCHVRLRGALLRRPLAHKGAVGRSGARPRDVAKFNGTVIVEWFNVTAMSDGGMFNTFGEWFTRQGYAYAGVSAQA